MAVTLSTAFKEQLKTAQNTPAVMLELWLDGGATTPIDKAFTYNGSTYGDITTNVNTPATDSQLFAASGDVLFIGQDDIFSALKVALATTASGDGIVPTFHYSSGSGAWTAFTPHDGTTGLTRDGIISWVLASAVGWSRETVNSVPGKYWIKITQTAVVTTYPVEDRISVLSPTRLGTHSAFADTLPVLKNVSSLQNKIDTSKGYSTRGNLKFTITGRENFRSLVKDEFLKNRRVNRYDGFVAEGFLFQDYVASFTGIISNWSRKGDDLTVTVSDDLDDASTKIPEENETDTQYIDYSNMNPVDIIQDILKTRLGIDSSLVDDAKMDSEQSTWLSGWTMNRVITKPQEATKYLNELQVETNSFIYHDGEKIGLKVFAPPLPGQDLPLWNDTEHIIDGSLSQDSGYKEQFYNRVIVYYDYDESGSDSEDNFESAQISIDGSSQASVEWNEVSTKTIKSKWIRNYTWNQPANINDPDVVITVYHVSKANGAGGGTLTFTAGSPATLTWTAPGGMAGDAVELSEDGKFTLYDIDETKFVRVILDTSSASLPGSNKTDTITTTLIDGERHAASLANKLLARYKNPAATVEFEVDINEVSNSGGFLKITDLVDLTTDEASEKGDDSWVAERLMITSMRPDYKGARVKIGASETKMYVNYAFISPASHVASWDDATALEKEYGFISGENEKLGAAYDPGYYIW